MRMRSLLFALLLFFIPIAAHAQTPIIVGPNTTLHWDEDSPIAGLTPAMVQAFTYGVFVDGSLAPITLASVSCVAATPVAPNLSQNDCSCPIAQIPIGSHTIAMTASNGTITSLPSVPFSYLDIVMPLPSGLHFK